MKPYDIIAIIEKTAPSGIAASWDASGVQVAALRQNITRLAVMLDPALECLRRAADEGADFILAHHPLSMKPRFPNVCDGYFSSLSLLFTRDIWLYSAHTSLDANPRGPAFWLAHALGLRELGVLDPLPEIQAIAVRTVQRTMPDSTLGNQGGQAMEAPAGFGFGFTGVLSESLPYADFCVRLAACLGKKGWQSCGPGPRQVSRVACCPGAGGSLLPAALRFGADLFITGDIKYHTALEAREGGLRILDVGHFILEEEMMRRFAGQLARELSVPVRFIAGRDPFVEECAQYTA
jgi:dinuclear metal center YbgI/SA1388 family protein